MIRFAAACAAFMLCGPVLAQERAAAQEHIVTLKTAVVALSIDPALREEVERGMVAKAREHRYDAITSFDLVPNVNDVDKRNFAASLAAKGVQAVLMVRPAAIGAGSSLDSVRKEVSPQVLASMRDFAKQVSSTGGKDLIAVVHLAIYTVDKDGSQPVSSGAVWLDQPVPSRAEGIERLENLILVNVDAARPAMRRHFGLPPLE